MLYLTTCPSPIGELTMVSDGYALKGLWAEKQKYYMVGVGECVPRDELELFQRVKAALSDYFSGKIPSFDFPIAPEGTPFQQRVWAVLRDIPYGESASYGEIAGKIGCASSRAVGNAVSRNPVLIVIPCHRVLGAGGSIGGFAAGINNKVTLLNIENVKYNV